MTKLERYDSLFQWYLGATEIPWQYAKAQALAESGLNPRAVSAAGAKGLTQFLEATFREVMGAGRDPFNPEDAIDAQSRYMAQLLRRFDGDLAQATAAYNCGLGRLGAILREHPEDWRAHLPRETRGYLTRIARLYAGLR